MGTYRKFPIKKCHVIQYSLNDPSTSSLQITDTNDLDPFFSPSSYSFDVPEDTPLHASVGRVHADDADEGVNGEIYYSLMRHHGSKVNVPEYFAVDPVSGVITLTRPVTFKVGSDGFNFPNRDIRLEK